MNNTTSKIVRSWEVLLICGASGVGKTSVSYRVAQHFGIGLTEVDDFNEVLVTMTTPEQQPALHFWRTHPDPGSLTAEQIVQQGLEVRDVMRPALEAVIANHLESQVPIVLEGDFIHPVLAVQNSFQEQPNNGRVRAIMIDEPDEAQLVQNFLQREPEEGEQITRAQVSRLYADWLRQQAAPPAITIIPARPWETVLERVLAALET